MDFPNAIPIDDLRATNAEYDSERLSQIDALYRGGKSFSDRVDSFLVRRPIEQLGASSEVNNTRESGMRQSNNIGQLHYERRKRLAFYTPRAAGLIDWLTAAVFRKEPEYINGGQYWSDLNKNCDGLGTDLPALARSVVKDIFQFQRGFFAVKFDAPNAIASESKTANARLIRIPSLSVDDWEKDEGGKYKWIRTYRKAMVRESPWSAKSKPVESWTFYTDLATYTYEAVEDEKIAALVKADPHDFKRMPIFPVYAPDHMWVANRVFDICKAIFNREVSITYGLDELAYGLLVLTLESPDRVSSLVDATVGALVMRPGEGAQFLAQTAQAFEPLFKDCERQKQALYEVIQALSINAAATQTQNARQSAAAKQMDRDPLQTLLQSFSWPIVDALENVAAELSRYRGLGEKPELAGLDGFDATMKDAAYAIGANKDQNEITSAANSEDDSEEE